MKYKVFQRSKIYQGNYEIRGYEWEKVLQRGMGARLELGTFDKRKVFTMTDFMLVPLAQVRKMGVANQVTGNQSGQTYLMRTIKWKPERVVKEIPIEINLSVRKRLSERFKNL